MIRALVRVAMSGIALWAGLIGAVMAVGQVMSAPSIIAYTRYLPSYQTDRRYFMRDLDRCIEHVIPLPLSIGALTWSPDGKQIAFVSGDRGDLLDIYVMDWNGRNIRRMTDSPARDAAPAWLPDSRHVAFSSDRDERHDYDLYVVDLDSGETRQLFDTDMNEYQVTFSPDGRYVAYPTSDATNTAAYVFIRDLQTGAVTEVVEGARYSFSPRWMPDGSRVIFLNELADAVEIRSYTLNGDTEDTDLLYVETRSGLQSFRSVDVLDAEGRLLILSEPVNAGQPGAWWMQILAPDGSVSEVPCAPHANFVTVRP